MKINTQQFDLADEEYSIKRPSMLHKIKEFMQSSQPLMVGCLTAAACVAGGVASAAYGASIELSIIQEHGKAAMDAYREMSYYTPTDFDSISNFAKATMNETITPAKGLVLGFVGGATSLLTAAAVKVGSIFTPETPTPTKVRTQFDVLRLNGKFGDQTEIGEKIGELAQLGTIDRWKATKDTPGLFSLVNSFESLAMKDPDRAEGLIYYMDEKTQPSTAPSV